jgi:hypothetical protein
VRLVPERFQGEAVLQGEAVRVNAQLKLDPKVMDVLRKKKVPIVPA